LISCLIDVGSSFIKYSIYDTRADRLLQSDKLPFPAPLIADGTRFRVSRREIADAVLLILRQAEQSDCDRVFFSVQMHGFLVCSPEGEWSEYISWRDTGGNLAQNRFGRVDFDSFGTSLKANLPLAKLSPRQKGCFFTLGSYLSFLLTGNNVTHITDACPSGLFYADSGLPNPFAEDLQLPRVTGQVVPVGQYQGMTVFCPVGDHQVSFLGSGAQQDAYLVNIGTATQLSCTAPAGLAAGGEKRPYLQPGLRLYTVSGLVGGDILYRQPEKVTLLLEQLQDALQKLPAKKKILFGGGGAAAVFPALQAVLSEDYICEYIERNIGAEGLKMLAQQAVPKLGIMLSEIAFSNFSVIAQNCGLDFMIIDSEHGAFDYTTLASLITPANLLGFDTVVRIGDASRANVTKLADMGVHGFLLPMTNTAEDIRRVVEYAKYAPIGKRGISTTRAHTGYNPPPLAEYMPAANARMKIYAQLETAAGVDNAPDILDVPGVDGVFIGPNDLACDLNAIGNKQLICECITRVANTAHAAGKPFGIITADKVLLDHAKKQGVAMVSIGSELNLLINGMKALKQQNS